MLPGLQDRQATCRQAAFEVKWPGIGPAVNPKASLRTGQFPQGATLFHGVSHSEEGGQLGKVMPVNARFVHTNLVARDWRKLARFYEQVLGCTPVLPERNLEGQWLEEATDVRGAHIRGIHLRLPGSGADGPTLEIFQYNTQQGKSGRAINRPGFAHIAFAVDDVEDAKEAVLSAGGGIIGKVVSLSVPGAGTVTFVYVTDPEGNIIELQRWSV